MDEGEQRRASGQSCRRTPRTGCRSGGNREELHSEFGRADGQLVGGAASPRGTTANQVGGIQESQ